MQRGENFLKVEMLMGYKKLRRQVKIFGEDS